MSMHLTEAAYLSSVRDRLAALANSERYSDEARATLRDVAGRLDMMLASEAIAAPAPDHDAQRAFAFALADAYGALPGRS